MKYVLPAVVALGVGTALPPIAARADETVQSSRPAYGCVDPRATTALAIPDGRLRNRKWVEYVHRTGQCALVPAGQPLTVLTHQGTMLLVKPVDAPPSALPVYVQSSDMTPAAAPAPVAPPDAPPAATVAASEPPPPAQAAPAATPAPESAPAAEAAPSSAPAPLPPTATASAPAPDTSQAPAGPSPNAAPAPGPAATPPVAPLSSAPSAQPSQGAGSSTPDAAAPAGNGPAEQPPAPPATAAPPAAVETTTPPPPAPVVAPTPAPEVRHGSSGIVWLLLILGLALLALVGAAVLISRQQRRFAHVEDKDWLQNDGGDPLESPSPVAPALHPEPTPQSFRKGCIEVLERGGWTIQPSFAAGVAREGAPDILGRRRDAVLAVRCRGGSATVTPEVIDEVAAMGQSARAHVIVLATPAPLTRRAHDEAVRLHVHVLDQDELASLSA